MGPGIRDMPEDGTWDTGAPPMEVVAQATATTPSPVIGRFRSGALPGNRQRCL